MTTPRHLPDRARITGRAVAGLIVALTLLAGCGGGDTAAPTGDRAEGATSTTPTTAPAEDTTPRPSPACVEGTTAARGVSEAPLDVDGTARSYRLFVPESLAADEPAPLLFNIHGLTSNSASQSTISEYEALADTEGFIVVAPQGLGSPSRWEIALDPNADVDFLDALLDEVGAQVCVDERRVYSSGLSNGGIMSSILACELADRVAAVGPVSGIFHPEDCVPSRPVPALVVWGRDDTVLPWMGGIGPGLTAVTSPGVDPADIVPPTEPAPADATFPPVEDVITRWAVDNGCAETHTVEPFADDVERWLWDDCPAGAEVELYLVLDGGHTWPGSIMGKAFEGEDANPLLAAIIGRTTDSFSASQVMWDFVSQYRLPA